MIEIRKASAGSGKTYTLARNYINILLRNKDVKDAYRHILAITFTNKATEEMKSRILKELYILSVDPGKSDFLGYFTKGEGADEDGYAPARFDTTEKLQEVAYRCLNNILNDYSAFAVSTIDAFFQRVLRSFTREIGHFANYQIELDRGSLLDETVARVLDSLSNEDRELLAWLTSGAVSSLEEGKKYNMERSLGDAAKRLKDFTHERAVEIYGINEAEAYSKENIRSIEKLCDEVQEAFAEKVRAAACKVLDAVKAAGLTTADFPKHIFTGNGIEAKKDFTKGNDYSFTETALKFMRGEKPLFNKSDKRAAAKTAALGNSLYEGFSELLALLEQPYIEYRTAMAIGKDLHDLGVAEEINREFEALMKEKNVMSLTESDSILKGIIGGSDAPFVYEKIGVRLENFLLDEFQDTSTVQWENIWPLLRESQSRESDFDAAAPYSLVVGDVKQSIYRWRGSEWDLLDKRIEKDFMNNGLDVNSKALDSNFRSLRAIVNFNNAFFPAAAAWLDGKLDMEGGEISRIYNKEETVQVCRSSEEQPGSVDISFVGKDSGKTSTDCVIEAVKEVMASGAGLKDIAVLVRKNADGARVAESLIEAGYAVLTNDSLRVDSSQVVKRVVAQLKYIDNPKDQVNRYWLKQAGCPLEDENGESNPALSPDCHSLIDLCEHYLRQAEEARPGILAAETPYIMSFLDAVQDYVASNGNDLHGFLEFWEGSGAMIASPEGGDAITVMTVHKSKGLEFPYVIYFYSKPNSELNIRNGSKFWCLPKAATGTALDSLSGSVFDVTLSGDSKNTMFREDYREEKLRLCVDVINVFYVAFTRPSKGLHIIVEEGGKGESFAKYLKDFVKKEGALPSLTGENVKGTDLCVGFMPVSKTQVEGENAGNESEVLRYRYGELYAFTQRPEKKGRLSPAAASVTLPLSFVSFPLNPAADGAETPMAACRRLKFSSDAMDFFARTDEIVYGASRRLRGTILHNIMASVILPSDLEAAVRASVHRGEMTEGQGQEVLKMLSEAIVSVSGYGFFPKDGSRVSNECSIIDCNGEVFRPDRVIQSPEATVIVDYKFGRREEKYTDQLKHYARLYERMGHSNVSAYLWYVAEGKDSVVKVL